MDAATSYLDPSRRPPSPRSNASLKTATVFNLDEGKSLVTTLLRSQQSRSHRLNSLAVFYHRGSVWCRLVARKETRRFRHSRFYVFFPVIVRRRGLSAVFVVESGFGNTFGHRLQGQPGRCRLEQGWKSWNDGFTLRDLQMNPMWMN